MSKEEILTAEAVGFLTILCGAHPRSAATGSLCSLKGPGGRIGYGAAVHASEDLMRFGLAKPDFAAPRSDDFYVATEDGLRVLRELQIAIAAGVEECSVALPGGRGFASVSLRGREVEVAS